MTERAYEIDIFRGLDTSNSPYDVQKNRAVEMNNLISIDGVNHKRKGFIERAKLDGRINGIWRYNENGTEIFIVHAGTKIYRVKLGENSLLTTATEIYSGAVDSKSWGLVDAEVLYILAGDYLAYGYIEKTKKYELVAIANSDFAYIPTTTVSIDPEGATEKTRSDFEPANLLNSKRKNTLQLINGENTVANRTFYLDSDINKKKPVEVEIECMDNMLETVTAHIKLSTKQANGSVEYGKELYLVDDNDKITSTKKGEITYELGKIVFDDMYKPIHEGEDGVIVTFEPAYTDSPSRITNCTFGAQFGLGGNNDRLFITGNPAYRNLDFYSESYNYMYFPVDNYTVLGGEQSAITGYSRINDGSLGIFKAEGDTSGIYYRSSTAQTYTDAVTGTSLTETIFPIKAGALGEYCADWRSCKRLGSDPLFVSGNGVYAVVIGNAITSNERYAKERSVNINNELTAGAGIYSAIAEVVDNKYMLFLGDKCYIADGRYKYSESKNADDTYNYEWWQWTLPGNVSATCKVGKLLVIGDSNGRIFTESSEYNDTTFKTLGAVTFSGNEAILPDKSRSELFNDKPVARVAYYDTSKVTNCYARLEGNKVKLYEEKACVTPETKSRPQNCKLAEVIEKPVESVFKSPLINLGSSTTLKTISTMYAVIDPITNTECKIRLESAARSTDIGFNLTGTFDFSNIDFENFSFGEELFSRTSMRRVNIRNANYIQFTISSDTDRDAVVNKIGITYTNTQQMKGGKN